MYGSVWTCLEVEKRKKVILVGMGENGRSREILSLLFPKKVLENGRF